MTLGYWENREPYPLASLTRELDTNYSDYKAHSFTPSTISIKHIVKHKSSFIVLSSCLVEAQCKNASMQCVI